jgi:hypothetical protein
MWRISVVLACTVLLVASQGPTTSATAADPPRYKTYVVCSAKKSAQPSHSCHVDKPKTAVFLSKDRDATYKVCVKFPGRKNKLCASHQPAQEDVKSGVSITSTKIGTHKVTWFVGGEKVGAYSFDVHD